MLFKNLIKMFDYVVQVLELGIIVHSVIIGLSLGASDNPCTIRPLVAALCFHQMFEGMGLGGCILQVFNPNHIITFSLSLLYDIDSYA